MTDITFNVQSLHINVRIEGDAHERPAFDAEKFPRLWEKEELNQLCYASLTAHTYDVAVFVAALIEGNYLFHNRKWYSFTGQIWKRCSGPCAFIRRDVTRVYKTLQQTYTQEKQVWWLNALITSLSNKDSRKDYIEDLQRYLEMNAARVQLDGDPHLISFANGVFDARDASFRDHKMSDCLTTMLSYEVPATPEPGIKADIEGFFVDVVPDEEVRDFLWLMLALQLGGENPEGTMMVWTGTGVSKKGLVQHLMKLAFNELHCELPASFLTAKSRSAYRPAPHLVKLRHTRTVFVAEPGRHEKINSAFLNFITGDNLIEARPAFYPKFLITVFCDAIPLFRGGEIEVRKALRNLRVIPFRQESIMEGTVMQQLTNWVPTFMRMLMDRYALYLAESRNIVTPTAVVIPPE
jgi:hypothetical protein